MAELRTEAHISEKGNICPNCHEKDTIIFQAAENKQATLTGGISGVYKKLDRPYCNACGKKFSKGTYFHKMR